MTGRTPRFRKTSIAAAALLAGSLVASGAMAQDRSDGLADEVVVQARVVALDVPNRLMILEGADGTYSNVVEIPRSIANLPRVEPGDTVTVKYLEALLLNVERAPNAEPGVEVTETQIRAEPGALPAGGNVRQVTMTAKLMAYDSNKHIAIIEGPGGSDRKVAVEGAELQNAMSAIQPGDVLRTTFTEAVALEVTRG